MKRIGMLTSGGDCQALNAAMRGVVKSLCVRHHRCAQQAGLRDAEPEAGRDRSSRGEGFRYRRIQ